ncbi:hypothetical protein [Segetibacter sp. 3557_3]|uniref:hypothetical protein n=1 Tax=Segetibacter sp. 3557_3 TaxID=2547429 RepID=UPI001405333D|nr:hypothetical protein [Segetibacter sp. 3557_3]
MEHHRDVSIAGNFTAWLRSTWSMKHTVYLHPVTSTGMVVLEKQNAPHRERLLY